MINLRNDVIMTPLEGLVHRSDGLDFFTELIGKVRVYC